MGTNKIALVTGGSRGLGKNAALRLAEQGHDIIISYNTKKEEAQAVVSEARALGRKAAALQLNIEDINSLDAFMAQLVGTLQQQWHTEKFDFLVNNAGVGATIPFAQATLQDFDRLMNIHYKGVFFLTQKCLPYLNNQGRVINLSSGTTRFVNPGYSIYASMKGAIEVLTRYLAKELGPRGISVNVVAPGPVETDFNNAGIRSNPELKSRLSSITALGRVGEAHDIGGIIAFLCSPDGYWINGQRIEASGGINL
jgi:NAD(P)-dependent dehydrogenase (short-subunit alcohol dehydrogenase family)